MSDSPGDDLASHLTACICKLPRQAEVGDLELAVGCYEQIVRLQILLFP